MAQKIVVLPILSLADAQRELERLARQVEVLIAGVSATPGTVSGDVIRAEVEAELLAGANVSITPSGVGPTRQLTIAAAAGGSGGVELTPSITTASLADGATENGSIVIARSSLLQKISASTECWIRFYETTAARTADAARDITTDPKAGTGLLSQSAPGLDLAGLTIPITPAHELHNGDSPRTTTIYYAITNKSGGAAAITVDLTVLSLEA